MAGTPEDRLATGERPEECGFPDHVGHPKFFSRRTWETAYGQKSLHCDCCTKWADSADHTAGTAHRNRMR
eukprot:3078382-Lingulodinium_polyedra.AAC.1